MAKLNWAVNPQQGREFRGDVLLDAERELRVTWFWGSGWGAWRQRVAARVGVDGEVAPEEEWA